MTEAQRKPVGMWGRAVRRLTSSDAEYVDDELARLARDSGCETLDGCTAGRRVHVQGRITMVTLSPRGGRDWLEADVRDGTGILTLVWMGRRSIRGIEAGRMVRVRGRLALRGRRRVMYNPHYELVD